MKRVRRTAFREKCMCWFVGAQSGKWTRFPPERSHETDRFDPSVGACVLACKEFPCLKAEERRSVVEMMERELRKAYQPCPKKYKQTLRLDRRKELLKQFCA